MKNENKKVTEIERAIEIAVNSESIIGDLTIPKDAIGIVIFAHGSGSSRLSVRNRFVARVLNETKIATFLVDLLTDKEEERDELTANLRFDIEFLTERLELVTEWVSNDPATKDFSIGYFGASTGAAAALLAASRLPNKIHAVVSRGGRPDLAATSLTYVRAPVLLIVGGNDKEVLELNKKALADIGSRIKELYIVPNATHLFEEKGALEKVAQKAKEWFKKYLYIGKGEFKYGKR